MHKVKVGDKVICISVPLGSPSDVKGKVCTVVKIDYDGLFVVTKDGDTFYGGYERFKLLSIKLKKGI